MSKLSPTQRTLKLLRDRGYTCGIVEKWNQFAHIRQDLFGFIDIVAIKPYPTVSTKEGLYSITSKPFESNGCGIIGVQCTSGSNHADHVTKIKMEGKALEWTEAGGKILMVSWSKTGARGKRKEWTAREEWL